MILKLAIELGSGEAFACEVDRPMEVGRQRDGEPEPFFFDGDRLVVASFEEVSISRSQLRIHSFDDQRVIIQNTSKTTPVQVTSLGSSLATGQTIVSALPVVCQLGDRTLRIESAERSPVHTLDYHTQAPGAVTRAPARLPAGQLNELATGLAQLDPLIRTLQQVVDMLQYATSEGELFQQACEAAVELLGLDQAQVLLQAEQGWQVSSEASADGATTSVLYAELLDSALREKRVSFEFRNVSDPTGPKSRDGFVVASPLLSQTGEVIGGLCACRRFKRADTGRLNVVRLLSQLLELISCAVASALLRIEQEKRSKTLQRQFDQFFTKKLSQHLKLQPDLLEGRDAEVSLLFCDIRDFTRHSDHLQASQIFSWINDVMETLSQCVLRYDGVLVDYIGDELVAMWGAPEHQPNHAVLACQAAMEMMQTLPQLNERWSSVLRRPLEVGIGINTGPVRVGNTGSQQKFKYGPLGTTVNIASRVQGATKYLDCPVLLAETTFLQLGEGFRTRELCQVRLVNLDRPIRIYELADATGCSQEVCAQYEQALATFARGQLETASGLLGRVLQQHPNDGPCRILLKRTLEYLIDENLKFDPAWSLPGK